MISNIYIKNFKILNDTDLVLSNLNIIAGKNSVGKSSLLQVLLLLRQSYEKNTLLSKGLLLQGDYIEIGKGKDALTFNTNDDYFQFLIDWEDGLTLDLQYRYEAKSDLQPILSEKSSLNSENISRQSLFNIGLGYLSADRIIPDTAYQLSDYYVNTLKSLGRRGEYTAHFLSENEHVVVEDSRLHHPLSKSDTLLNQVNAWMSEIAAGIKISTKVIEEINRVSLSFEFLTENGYTDKFTPHNVGFGLTYVLPVVTALLSAKKGDLLLVENPEAHLHPAGQSAMGKLLALAAQSGVQIFAETHSDHLLNGVRIAVAQKNIEKENISIIYFSKDEKLKQHHTNVDMPFIDDKGRINEWPKGFFDEWDLRLDDLLDA